MNGFFFVRNQHLNVAFLLTQAAQSGVALDGLVQQTRPKGILSRT